MVFKEMYMITETNAAIISDTIPGPKAKELFDRRMQAVARGISYNAVLFVKEAKGALIKDVDDNVFIDFAAGIGVQNIGHSNEDFINAVTEQVKKYTHTSINIAMYEPYIALAEQLIAITPGSSEKKVMFANSGAEAVENALKIARKYTRKQGVISLECAYHGRTYAAMTLTSKVKPYKFEFGPFLSEFYKIPSAYCYRCPYKSTYPGCGLACAERLDTMLKGELVPEAIAAFIAEPIQGEGGFIVPPREYLPAMESICRKNNIVFIIDEVQAGFARTGKFFASEHFDIHPDIMTLSKSIAGGLPLSAVVGSKEIMDSPDPGQIGGTFCGNPVACNAGLQVIKIIKENSLELQAQHIGGMIKDRLVLMQDKYQCIGDVRGLGAMVAVEFVKDRKTKEPYADIIKKIISYAFEKGVILMSAGIFSNVIRFLPPLVMTDAQVNYGMDVLEKAIDCCSK